MGRGNQIPAGELTEIVGEHSARAKGWPRTERALTSRLKQLATFLRRVGVLVTWAEERTNHGRMITIRSRRRELRAEPSQRSQPSPNTKISSIFHGMGGVTVSESAQPQPHRQSQPSQLQRPTVTIRSRLPRNSLQTNGNDGRDDRDSCGARDPGADLEIPEFLRREPHPAPRPNPPELGPPGDSLDDFR
jgi:hypothetical protein